MVDCWAVVTAPSQRLVSAPSLHMNTAIWTLSYQNPLARLTSERMSMPAPKSTSDTQTVTMTATVIVRLRRRPPPSSEAVSYTHLRAHETDSYLVCRLLLE